MELLRALKDQLSDLTLILLTAQGTVETAVEAIKEGAYDYLSKPVDPQRLQILLKKAVERQDTLREVRHLYTPFMTPGSVTERLSFFVGDYSKADRVSEGGGASHEGEDIEVLEMPLEEALAAVGDGRIVDAKTILLLQHLKLELLSGH